MTKEQQEMWDALRYNIVVDEYGTKFWYLNGVLHRPNGPAIEYHCSDRLMAFNRRMGLSRDPIQYSWWLYGILLSEEEFKFRMQIKELRE